MSMFERALYVDGQTPVAIVLVAKLCGRIGADRLRQALDRVQAKHPLLRCLVPAGPGAPRFVVQQQPPPIPLRILARRGEDDWLREADADRRVPFDASRLPLLRMTWLRGQATSDLVLTAHHCLCDGRAMVGMLRDLLRVCDCPGDDIGIYEGLTDPIKLLPGEVLDDRRLGWSLRARAALFRMFVRAWKPGPPRSYGDQYLLHWELEPGLAGPLSEHCRQQGVTLTTAVSAAFQLAFRELQTTQGPRRLAIPVDARRFLAKLPGDAFFAMAPTVKLPFRRVDSSDVWMQARKLGEALRRTSGNMAADFFRNMLALEHLHAVFPRLVAFSRALPGGRDLIFSNLGRLDLDADYRGFRLEAVHAPLCMLSPTTAHLLTCIGYAERLELCFMSDEASLPRALAMAIKERAMLLLSAHPGVPGMLQKPHPLPAAATRG